MEALRLAETDDTPEIILDKGTGVFTLKGKSLPEDVIGFYSPVFSWLEQYAANPNDETTVKVKIVYFNSASQRALNEVFTILSRVALKGKKVEVEWFFNQDDEEIQEAGEEYADITKLPFRYISYQPD